MSFLEIAPGERAHVEYLADLFALVTAIEQVERASRRDLITAEQYSTTVRRLLDKYNSTVTSLVSSHNPFFTSAEDFLDTYCSRCPAARVTIKDGPKGTSAESAARFLARNSVECTSLIITLMDSVHLQQTSADTLNPLLTDLLQGLARLGLSQRDVVTRLSAWKVRLDGMSAADMLGEADTRDFSYDLERVHTCLRNYIDNDPEFTHVQVSGK